MHAMWCKQFIIKVNILPKSILTFMILELFYMQLMKIIHSPLTDLWNERRGASETFYFTPHKDKNRRIQHFELHNLGGHIVKSHNFGQPLGVYVSLYRKDIVLRYAHRTKDAANVA